MTMLDTTSRDKLITENMTLVYFLLNRYYSRFNDDDDMKQAGMIGLIKAADTWDDTQAKFSSYASRCIMNEFLREFRKRKKQPQTLSLDSVINESDDCDISLMDVIVGEDDVEVGDAHSTERFYDSLNDKDKEFMGHLKKGKTPREIATIYGCSTQWVYNKRNRLKHKWHKFHDAKK